MTCSCGDRYADFRTGLTFTEVRHMLMGTDRQYVRRNGVLGFWHELKLMYWDLQHGGCV